jgi:4-hydroxy-3-methylbut-2-enyl diphosphate reductase
VHVEVGKMRKGEREVVMIGHKGHPEVEGTMGQSDGGMYLVDTVEDVEQLVVRDPDHLSFVTQTTLSVDDATVVIEALRKRFPTIQGPKKDDICYATQNRQDAVKALAEMCDLVIVVGSSNSSNSRRLVEVAIAKNVRAFLVDEPSAIKTEWFNGVDKVGISAGASAPELLVRDVIDKVGEIMPSKVVQIAGTEEGVVFAIPKELA